MQEDTSTMSPPTSWQLHIYDRLDELRQRWTDAEQPPPEVGPLSSRPEPSKTNGSHPPTRHCSGALPAFLRRREAGCYIEPTAPARVSSDSKRAWLRLTVEPRVTSAFSHVPVRKRSRSRANIGELPW